MLQWVLMSIAPRDTKQSKIDVNSHSNGAISLIFLTRAIPLIFIIRCYNFFKNQFNLGKVYGPWENQQLETGPFVRGARGSLELGYHFHRPHLLGFVLRLMQSARSSSSLISSGLIIGPIASRPTITIMAMPPYHQQNSINLG